MQLYAPIVLAGLAGVLSAQTTWIVDAGGGPGVSFGDLPSAVAAAADGDTIVVRTGPLGEGATAFTTSKGLTILGDGGAVPITTSPAAPIVVQNLPATSAFRMAGFARVSNGALDLQVVDCQGLVHFERMTCREPGPFFPTTPSLVVRNSPNVTLRALQEFGTPALAVDGSVVVVHGCRLGQTSIGLGGGPWIDAVDSTVYVVDPRFRSGYGAPSAVTLEQSELWLAGRAGSSMINLNGDVVTGVGVGGSVRYAPTVSLLGNALFTGPLTTLSTTVPASYVDGVTAGPLDLETQASFGDVVFLALGEPGPLAPSPLGTLGIDPNGWFAFFPPAVVNSSFLVSSALTVPPSIAPGTAFTAQAVLLSGGALAVGLPVTFVVP